MATRHWQELAFSSQTDSPLWELFHENAKLSRFSPGLSDEEVRDYVSQLHESLPFDGLPVVPLPSHLPALKMPLGKTLRSRESHRDLSPGTLTLKHLAALMHFGYGISRPNADPLVSRPLRMIPSAGALYPLEIFVYSKRVKNLHPGLYHYNPSQHQLRFLREGDQSDELARLLVQETIPASVSLLIFITALFERSVYKYGERGYRFALLEAGHAAQNINLVSTGLGLGCLNIGGFFDREVDAFLSLDGIAQSTIYMIAVGTRAHPLPSRRQNLKRRT